MTQPQSAVVIGAGFGGLAAALRLAALGHRVRVIDPLPLAGGRARVIHRGSFRYDAGPTVITAPSLLRELFALFGERLHDHVELLPVKPWYRMQFADGTHLDYVAQADGLREEIARLSPPDAARYPAFLEATRRRYASGYTAWADQPFSSWGAMLRVLPDILRLRAYRSVYAFVSDHFKDERLRRAFSIQPLLIGGNPFNTPSLYALIHYLEQDEGIWFPRGGTGALVRALVALGERHGVEFEPGARAVEIGLGDDGRACNVAAHDGRRWSADLVVANADPGRVYASLLPPARVGRWTPRRLQRVDYSMSLFVMYFSVTGRYDSVPHHTILFGRQYRETLAGIFRGREVPQDLSIYLHRPCATDPDMAPPGHDSLYALVPVPNLRSGIDWAQEGERLCERLTDALQERLLPNLRARLVDRSFVTPNYFRDRLQTPAGAAFSMSPTLQQSAALRFPGRSERVPNLFFVGAGVHPGAGVPGALLSAKVAERFWLPRGATA